MNHKHYMVTTKVIFTVIAVMHIMRAFLGYSIVINGHIVPIWISWVGFLVAGYLAYSAEKLSKKY